MWNICRNSHKVKSWASLMHYLYNWYCPHTCLTEQTICRWHFVRLFKSGYNAVEKCYRSWFEWNGHIVMIFSNRSIPKNLDFSFNGKSVLITISHKHLGVSFSNDTKWNTHVDNIQSSVYIWIFYVDWSTVLVELINYILCILDHFLNMHVNYEITVGLEIHKNWNNFNWKLPGFFHAYIF